MHVRDWAEIVAHDFELSFAMGSKCPRDISQAQSRGHSLLVVDTLIVIQIEALLEEQDAAITQRRERCYVTAIEPPFNAEPHAGAGELQLGVRAGPQARA